MRSFIKAALFASVFLVGVSVAHAQVSVGIGITIGQPPPPRVVRVLPPRPGPGFFWVAGYWYPVRGRYVWHSGYWTRPPYQGAVWVAPRYDHDDGRYFEGYWNGPRGRVDHDHRWDHERERDFDRWRPDREHHDRGDRDDHDHHDHDHHDH